LGTLDASGKGYRGGISPMNDGERGFQGETFNSSSSQSVLSNEGGGGGGESELFDPNLSYGKPGGGAGYGSAG